MAILFGSFGAKEVGLGSQEGRKKILYKAFK